ncbi:hypothetical protein F1737_09740 [Methanoplanus sp. FWC-SCC4]|uniref:Lipoprotein n=1 Tax=Methanochimaera problematica TaxID=2609417 RepID=A0AA97FDN7_9EURY|nr:hypothetical protein [Methanoplanus sp. FWC-SCC4]WOF16947.1 hypothetical protein F1737_09740 [Methanoplanus sp. FWC-SCC4]
MIKNTVLLYIISFLILLTIFSGCIEGSFEKTDTVLMKLDSKENIQWTSVFENNDYNIPRSYAPGPSQFMQTLDNGYFIVSVLRNSSMGNYLRILKTDCKGNIVFNKQIPGQTRTIETLLAIVERDDRGYSIFWKDGHVDNFNASGTMQTGINIPDDLHLIGGATYPEMFVSSVFTTSNGNICAVLTGGGFNIMQKPVLIAGISQNGTLLSKRPDDMINIAGATDILATNDGGFLIGKFYYYHTEGGQKILIEKTDANNTQIWNTTLLKCNYTLCKPNDLIGMHENSAGYDIIYLSRKHGNFTSDDLEGIVRTRFDINGQVQKKEFLKNISELPLWLFKGGSSLEFPSLINESIRLSMTHDKNQKINCVSLLKTGDGGYALLGTRYYYGWL